MLKGAEKPIFLDPIFFFQDNPEPRDHFPTKFQRLESRGARDAIGIGKAGAGARRDLGRGTGKNGKIESVISYGEIPLLELGNTAKWVRARIELVQRLQRCTADLSSPPPAPPPRPPAP